MLEDNEGQVEPVVAQSELEEQQTQDGPETDEFGEYEDTPVGRVYADGYRIDAATGKHFLSDGTEVLEDDTIVLPEDDGQHTETTPGPSTTAKPAQSAVPTFLPSLGAVPRMRAEESLTESQQAEYNEIVSYNPAGGLMLLAKIQREIDTQEKSADSVYRQSVENSVRQVPVLQQYKQYLMEQGEAMTAIQRSRPDAVGMVVKEAVGRAVVNNPELLNQILPLITGGTPSKPVASKRPAPLPAASKVPTGTARSTTRTTTTGRRQVDDLAMKRMMSSSKLTREEAKVLLGRS